MERASKRFRPLPLAGAIFGLLVTWSAAPGGAAPRSGVAQPAAVEMPLPPPRPGDLSPPPPPPPEAMPPEAPPLPPPRPDAPASPPEATPAPIAVDHEACLARLAQLGMRFESLPAISQGTCGAERPLRVFGFPDGVEIVPAATLTCPAAEALGRWILESAGTEAGHLLDRRLLKILNGTSYECRGQNRQADAKLSEHAFANAVDVMGFAFRDRADIAVAGQAGDTPEARFLAAVRAGACRYFSTVLGPGTDATHADHLHLDLRARKQGARLCQ